MDLYRPVPLIGWYVAQDLGRRRTTCCHGGGPHDRRRAAVRHPVPRHAAAWLGVRRQRGAGGAGQLRNPLPGGHHGLLAARRDRTRDARTFRRLFFSGLTLPLVSSRAGPQLCLASRGRRSSRSRPTSGSASHREGPVAGLALRRSGPRSCWASGWSSLRRGDPQGGGAGWLREPPAGVVVERARRTATSRRCGPAPRWRTPRRSG